MEPGSFLLERRCREWSVGLLFSANRNVQCSGTHPCSNCSRSSKPCIFVAAGTDVPIIILDNNRNRSSAARSVVRQRPAAPRLSPAMDDERYFYYFDVFAHRNSFSGKNRLFTEDVKRMGELQRLPYFLDSIRALGAIQAHKLALPSQSRQAGDAYTSYALYSQAVIGLRKSLDRQKHGMSDSDRTALLWTTLFLGMFEVGLLPVMIL